VIHNFIGTFDPDDQPGLGFRGRVLTQIQIYLELAIVGAQRSQRVSGKKGRKLPKQCG